MSARRVSFGNQASSTRATKGALTMHTADDRFRATMKDVDDDEHARRFKGPGGTPGGVGMFLFGLALAIAGGYLIMNQI